MIIVRREVDAPAALKRLAEGTRVRVGGGHALNPEWLTLVGGREAGVSGRIVHFLTGSDGKRRAIVELDAPLRVKLATGETVVGDRLHLGLRHARERWTSGAVVGVALVVPREATDGEREEYVEAAAVVRALTSPEK